MSYSKLGKYRYGDQFKRQNSVNHRRQPRSWVCYGEGAVRSRIECHNRCPKREKLRGRTSGIGNKRSGDIFSYRCDVQDANEIDNLFNHISKDIGPVDILINNAGRSAAKPFNLISDEEWRDDIDLKLMAAIRLSRLVWEDMKKKNWGRIINLLNVYAKAPGAETAPTSVTRAAGWP